MTLLSIAKEHNINSSWLYYQWCFIEKGLHGGSRNNKLRNFPSATVDGLNHHIIWLLQKKPTHIIVHAGTNELYHSTSREILKKLLNFKSFIQEKLCDCKVYILTPRLRSDHGKATLTVNQLTNHLLQLRIDIVDNGNIISKHLSRKVLHLNDSSSRSLAINFLECIKKFWKNERYASRCPEEDELAIFSKKSNLSNNHVESNKKKDKCQNINLKSLREVNPNGPFLCKLT